MYDICNYSSLPALLSAVDSVTTMSQPSETAVAEEIETQAPMAALPSATELLGWVNTTSPSVKMRTQLYVHALVGKSKSSGTYMYA